MSDAAALKTQMTPPANASTGARDRVTAQIVANALAATADDMATTIFRTAHSAILRDAMDFSAALCAANGETVAQAVTIPLQLGSIPTAMASLLARFDGDFHEGDSFILNDPFDGGSHLPDIFIASPVFLERALVGFAVSIAHHGDVGGRVPGSIACDNEDIFQEGLRLPWLRLVNAGRPNQDIFRIIEANVRLPDELLGDLHAQMAACTIGERGLRELAVRYSPDGLHVMMAELLDHSEALMRAEIAAWPDRTVTFTDYLDSDGFTVRDVPLTVDLTILGEEITADFSRSAPMVRGALNCTKSFAEASVYQAVMGAAKAAIPPTSGAIRPVHVITRPGTITDVVMPGPSSMRGVTGYRLFDVINGALAQLVPDRIPAAGEGGSTLAVFTGARAHGTQYVYDELVVGTWGGRPTCDGNDGLANACASMSNIPVEVAETEYPIFVERYGLVPDSGGAGKFRGGLAIERAWRALEDTLLQVRSDRQVHAPYGLSGGEPGARSGNEIRRGDGSVERWPPMFGTALRTGDVYHHTMAGGGGWGDPLDRDPDSVATDVRDGKVTRQRAMASYGVRIDEHGKAHLPATERERQRLRQLRRDGDASAPS